MPYRLQSDGPHKAMRCAVCEGKFGLVRHHWWRTPLAPGSASTSSRRAAKVTTTGWGGSKSLSTSRPKTARGVMTLQISQRGKEYLKTAQTLHRAAKTMTTKRLRLSLRL